MKTLLILFAFVFSSALFAQVDLVNMPVNTWLSIPNTPMSAVDPCPARNCSYSGAEGQPAVMNDWCGGVFDTKRNRLVIWGGGHAGYFGNELYAFNVDSLKWFRLTDPSTTISFTQDPMADGKPLSRHTYGGMAYMSHADQFFAMGGSGANNGYALHNTWTFDITSKTWTSKGNCGFGAGLGSTCTYDPSTKKVYWGEGNNSSDVAWGMWSYTYETNTWTRLNTKRPYYLYASAFDTKRGLLFFIGGGNVYVYDVKNANFTEQAWTTTGSTGFIGKTEAGLDYDPVSDKIVGWGGGGIFALNPDTKVWTVYNASGEPSPNGNGTYGRFRYVPKVNAFVLVNTTAANVYFYKLTAGLGAGISRESAHPVGAMDLAVSPNPCAGTAVISAGNAGGIEQLKVFDLKGACVKSVMPRPGETRISFSTESFSQGVYLLKARTMGRIITKPFYVVK
jgi:hypothetical protein